MTKMLLQLWMQGKMAFATSSTGVAVCVGPAVAGKQPNAKGLVVGGLCTGLGFDSRHALVVVHLPVFEQLAPV